MLVVVIPVTIFSNVMCRSTTRGCRTMNTANVDSAQNSAKPFLALHVDHVHLEIASIQIKSSLGCNQTYSVSRLSMGPDYNFYVNLFSSAIHQTFTILSRGLVGFLQTQNIAWFMYQLCIIRESPLQHRNWVIESFKLACWIFISASGQLKTYSADLVDHVIYRRRRGLIQPNLSQSIVDRVGNPAGINWLLFS